MNYQETKFTKFIGSTAFYTVIALCIVALGVASWFAITKVRQFDSGAESSSMPDGSDAESGLFSSSKFDDMFEPESQVESTAKNVSSEPYDSSESETEPAEEAESLQFPVEGQVSKVFSLTELQYSSTYSDMRLHTGTDIACEKGAEVVSAGKGTVKSVEESATLGALVVIDHGNGLEIKYCGLDGIAVKTGDTVKAGSRLGKAAEVPSECADQSHIHIECFKDGQPVSFEALMHS